MIALLVPLAFLGCVPLALAVRDVKMAVVDLLDTMTPLPLNMEGDETEATQLINKLEVAILTRNQGVSVESYLEKMFTSPRAKNCDATSAPGLALYAAGWACAVQPLGLSASEADLLMSMLGTPDAAQKTLYITTSTVKAAILGQGTAEEREQVLAFVWKKVTGHGTEAGTLEPEDLQCKKPDLRETFINYIKEKAGAPASAPLTYDVFRAYYMSLGAGITSHRLFVLMVVNAWHIMDTPYDYVNTVNIRVRAVKQGEDNNAGKVYALHDDCGSKPGEESLDKLGRIKKRLEEQTGETFKSVRLSDRV